MADNRWTQASLTDVVETWIVGSTPSRADPSRFALKGGAPWAKVEDVTGGVLYETAERLSKRGESGMQRIPEGAVLVTTAGTIGRTAIAGREMFCNQAVQALSFRRDVILPQFGYYFLRCQRPLLQHLANSTTIRRISKGELQRVQLRYPSLSVQERMIEQVRGPELLAEKAGQFQQLLEKFLLAVTAQAARYTKNYLPIGDLLEEDPLTGLRTKASPTGNGIPLVNKLRGGGRLARLESYPRVQVQTRQISRYSLRPMDLLLRGSTLGADPRGILVGDLPEEALVGGDLVRLRLRPSVSPAWLLAWLRGPGETVCTKTAGCKSRCCESTGSPSRRDRRSLDRSFCCTGPWRKRRLNLPNGLKPCLTLFCAGSFPKARWKSPLGNSPRIA